MSGGRGRGRPPRTTPPSTPVPQSADSGMRPPAPSMMPPMTAQMNPAAAVAASNFMMGTGPGGTPSFTTDILSQLPPEKQHIMINLVNRFKGKQISIHEFLGQSKVLLGDRLYQILAQGMSSAVRVPPSEGPRPPMPMTRPPMPSMPAMFPGQGMMSSNNASSAPAAAGAEVYDPSDVTKMDSASLQDVIQYSGIDLSAEAEMIQSEFTMPSGSFAATASQDLRLRPDFFFNLTRLKALVYMTARAKGLSSVNEDVFDLLALAVQRRLGNVITGMAEISKHRVDLKRSSFKIKVENDPKKQIWLLEKLLEEAADRLQANGGIGAAADDKAAGKGKKAGAGEKGVGGRAGGGEDVLVKTRLANTTALAALGVQQKSWMTAGIVGLQAAAARIPEASSTAESGDGTNNSTEPMEPVKIPLHFSQAPSLTPATDRDLAAQLAQRRLTVKDLVFYCERDPHLARSKIMLTLYDLVNF